MSIQTIDNFELSVPKPIDNRIVVGPGFFYTSKDLITLPYEGLRVYDLNDNTPYVFLSATWSYENNGFFTNDDNTSPLWHYLTFVGATAGLNPAKVSGNKLRYRPSTGQIILSGGSPNFPTLGFTGSSSFGLGMYKSSNQSLGFSIAGNKYFDIGLQTTTASSRFKVAASPIGGNQGEGTLGVGISSGSINFEFYPYSNSSTFRIFNLSPIQSVSGYSNTTTQTTALDFTNYQQYSGYSVRDIHYFNTESRRGTIRLGNYSVSGTDNDQFLFYMKDFTTGNSPFSTNGGGLSIQNNLNVGGTSLLSATVSVMSNLVVGANNFIYKIDPGAIFFADSTPKAEIITGLSSGAYQELFVIRHPVVDSSSVTRRLGNIMKLSSESLPFETPKMGGMILESVDGYANYPGLFFLTEDKKRIQIDHQGNIGLGNVSESSTWNRLNIAANSSIFISQANGQAQFKNGVYNVPSISFINSTTSGFYFSPTIYVTCPDPDTLILISDGQSIRAGDLKVDDFVYTVHEKTGIWGNYKVTFAEIYHNQEKLLIQFNDNSDIKVSDSHKFLMTDGQWKKSIDLSIGDSIKGKDIDKIVSSVTPIGKGDVVKIEVEDAHTYVSAGLISHNKVLIFDTPGYIGVSVNGNKIATFEEANPVSPYSLPKRLLLDDSMISSISFGAQTTIGGKNLRIGANINGGAGKDVAVNIGTVNDGTNNGMIQVLNNANAAPYIGTSAYRLALQPGGGDLLLGSSTSAVALYGNGIIFNTSNNYPQVSVANPALYTTQVLYNGQTFVTQINPASYDRYVSVIATIQMIYGYFGAAGPGNGGVAYGEAYIDFTIGQFGPLICRLETGTTFHLHPGVAAASSTYTDGPHHSKGFFIPAGVTVWVKMLANINTSGVNFTITSLTEFKIGL